MTLAPIRDEAGYVTVVDEMRRLWRAAPGTPERDRLDVLGMLVEAYENETWPFEPRDPVEAIKGHMENEGLGHKALADLLQSKARASEILARKRALTLPMIWKLSREWKIPAEILIQPYALAARRKKKSARHGFAVRHKAGKGGAAAPVGPKSRSRTRRSHVKHRERVG